MLVAHTNYSIRESVYPFVYLHEWEELGRYLKLNVGREKDAEDDLLAKRRGAWNRMTANFFREGDWEIVCQWVEERIDELDSQHQSLIDGERDVVQEYIVDRIKDRHICWERFREKFVQSMEVE